MEATAPGLRSTFLTKCPPSLFKFLFCAFLGISIWFMPVPAALNPAGWKVFAVFIFTLSGNDIKTNAPWLDNLDGFGYFGADKRFVV